MALMLLVLGGVFTAMTNAMEAERTAREITGLNGTPARRRWTSSSATCCRSARACQPAAASAFPTARARRAIVRPGSGMPTRACAGVTPVRRSDVAPGSHRRAGSRSPRQRRLHRHRDDAGGGLAFETEGGGRPLLPTAARSPSTTTSTSTARPDVDGMQQRPARRSALRPRARQHAAQVPASDGDLTSTGRPSPSRPAIRWGGTSARGLAERPAGHRQAPADAGRPMRQPAWGTGQATASRMITYFVDTMTNPASPRLMRISTPGRRPPWHSSSRPYASPTTLPTVC